MEKCSKAVENKQVKSSQLNSSKKSPLKRGKTEKEIANLRQEIDILKKLRHQNIILLLDWFETDSEFGVVTEYAQGELFEILEEDKKMSEDQIRKIALQLAEALYYLHSNRIIHRDMKPQNILIGSGGVIKLCDFGFARAMSQSTMVLTSIKGTPLYMAPELVQDQPYNHSVDLWSFGIILYELFMGEPPFYTNKLTSLIQLIIKKSIKYPDNISPEFRSFLSQLLVKEPNKRLDWPDLLEHPFLQKTNVDLIVEQQLVERYTDWMAKLATWNTGFREFGNRSVSLPKINTQTTPGKQPQIIECDRIPLKELILTSKKDTMSKNQKTALEMLGNCIVEIENQVSQNGREELEESDFSDFSALVSLILITFVDYDSFEKMRKGFSTSFKNIGKRMSLNRQNLQQSIWFLSASIKFAQKSSEITETISIFLSSFKSMLITTDLQSKEYNSFLTFLAAIQARFGMRLEDSAFTINFIRQNKLFELILSPKIATSMFLKNNFIIETIALIIVPETTDFITFPLLKSKNITSKRARLDGQALNLLLDFNEYVQFTLFTMFDKLKWIECITLDDMYFLKILLQFLRISDDCVKQAISHEALGKAINDSILSFSHKSIDLQELFLQIYTEINKSKQSKIYITHEQVKELFHKEDNHFLCMLYFNFLSSLMDDPIFAKRLIINGSQFSPELIYTIELVKGFFEHSYNQNWGKLIKEDFVNSGFVLLGVHDSALKFMRQLLILCRRSRELLIEYITKLGSKNLHVLMFGIYEKMDRDFYLSLKGLFTFLNLTIELLSVSKEHLLFVELLVKEQTIKNILLLLSDEKNKAIQEWPKKLSGSSLFLDNTKCSVVKILEMVLGTLIKSTNATLLNNFSNQLKSCSTLFREILSAYEINASLSDGSTSGNKDIRQRRPVRMTFIVTMFKNQELEKHALREFLNFGGIEFITRNGGLNLSLTDEVQQNVLNDHLSILIQLSVESKECYPAINAMKFYDGLLIILNNGSEPLKEKACRLVGHLCKHSDYFYSKFDGANVIEMLTFLCKDPSLMIRRSVCLALGNAAFHSDALYKKLAKALPFILMLTSDQDERVRTNAIGTINNLIRNSEALFGLMLELNVLQILREVVLKDSSLVE